MAVRIPSHLYLNPYGVYHFRIAVPHELRVIFGKREIKKSLRTSNRRQAIRMAQKLSVKVHDIFEEMRHMAGNKNPDTGIIVLKGLKKEKDSVSIDEFTVDLDDKKKEADIAEGLVKALKGHPAALEGVVTAARRGNRTLSHVISKLCKEKKTEEWTPRTLKEFQGMFRLIIEILGDRPMNTIGHDEAEHLRDILLKLPPNCRNNSKYKSLTIEQILTLKHSKTMSKKTVNKYISLMSTLFRYAEIKDYTDKNYFNKLGVKIKQKAHKERAPFTQEDITQLFSPEFFSQEKFQHPYMYWVPLIGLYTGARLEEICQLHLDDIRQEEGRPFLIYF